jgi:hypothetical protein
MRKRVVTSKKEKEFDCLIFNRVILEFACNLVKWILSSSISAGIHNISTAFALWNI